MSIEGIVWAPDDDALTVDPAWIRLDSGSGGPPPTKVMKADGAAASAYATFNYSSHTEAWFTFRLGLTSEALALFTDPSSGNRGDFAFLRGWGKHFYVQDPDNDFWGDGTNSGSVPVPVVGWQLIEIHHHSGVIREFFVDGTSVWSVALGGSTTTIGINLGLNTNTIPDPPVQALYYDDVKIGTTRGGTEIFADDFSDGTLDAWTSVTGDASVVDDPFAAPAGYRLATSFQIARGRSSETDKVTTGTATITFRDTEGILDPTNPSSPFWDATDTPPAEGNTKLDPMKQAAIALRNPVTDTWHTLFRGFVAGPDHELDMFTEEQGFDVVTWQLVDAFDLFANVILTHGAHGDTPSLASFPNIYYQGTPSNLPEESNVFVHVDQRIAKLLDDADWPGTGETIDVANLRNIFSGNVSVQGTVYSRKDSLLSALFDACDAEFPGIGNFYMDKEGVATFHGRFARFFPTRPGYGINQWYVGSLSEAALDPDVAPHAGPLKFYRSKDDIINASYALPQGVDETDGSVVHASDTASQGKYGYRSENFDGLIVSAGHGVPGDDNAPTTAVEEANKFADYYVGNYAQPKTRVGTLRFTARGPDAVGAPALWDLMTRVELGDVITLTSAHPGGGGFGGDWFVEHIAYSVSPARDDMLNVVLELEVSPATFFSYNPFGSHDSGDS